MASSRTRTRSGDGVDIVDGRVFKDVLFDSKSEVAKINAVADAALGHSFIAPKARFDEPSGRIVIDLVELSAGISVSYSNYVRSPLQDVEHECSTLVTQAGVALREIHDGLAQANGPAPAGEVWLHGDYGFSNLHVAVTGELVILDPMPDGYSTTEIWETGDPAIDLAMLMSCLVGRARATTVLRARTDRIVDLVYALIDGYGASRAELDTILEHTKEIAIAYFSSPNTRFAKRHIGRRLWLLRLWLLRRSIGPKS